jgi:hypothetical protein
MAGCGCPPSGMPAGSMPPASFMTIPGSTIKMDKCGPCAPAIEFQNTPVGDLATRGTPQQGPNFGTLNARVQQFGMFM